MPRVESYSSQRERNDDFLQFAVSLPPVVDARFGRFENSTMSARDAATMYVIDVGAFERIARASSASSSSSSSSDDARSVVASAVHDCISAFVASRTKSLKEHTRGLTLFGCARTSNDVATAAREEDGGDDALDEYAGIVSASSLKPPKKKTGLDYETLVRLEQAAKDAQTRPGDCAEALAVACDALIRRYTPEDATAATRKRLAACVKDVVLITDEAACSEFPDRTQDGFASTLFEGMRAQNVRLRVGILTANEIARMRGEPGAEISSETESEQTPDFAKSLAALHEGANFLAGEDSSNESGVCGAASLLLSMQLKKVRPTAGFRGVLSFGFGAALNVAMYKLNTEAKPPALTRYSDELEADRPDATHRAELDVAFKNVNDLDGQLVPVERHIRAYRYGKQHVPVDADTESRLSMRFDKGMQVIGSVAVEEVPIWLSAGEPSVLTPQASTKTTGLTPQRVKADAKAMSAIAQALERGKLALLVRGAWSDSANAVHIGALTPRITEAGDFLLYTPLPFKEDYNEYCLPPPLPSSRIGADDARIAEALDFVRAHSIDEAYAMPWEALNPSLRECRDAFDARAGGVPVELRRKPTSFGADEKRAASFAATFALVDKVVASVGDRNVRPRIEDAPERAGKTTKPSEPAERERRMPSPSFAADGVNDDDTNNPWVDVIKREDDDDAAATQPNAQHVPSVDLNFDEME